MEKVQARLTTVFETHKGDFGYQNVNQAPTIEKVVVSVGTGRVDDKAKIALIQDRLARITGQKAAPRAARMSIASFKLREGDIVGYQVTLRGQRMMDFLNKLIHVAIPQTRDFRGLKATSVDDMGNYTMGVKEHTIFPETADEDIRDVFGMSITIVTTASNKPEAEALLRHIGMPLQKKATEKAAAKTPTPTEAAPAPETTKPSTETDDLTKIEGIGPVIAKTLNEAGIATFAAVATSDVEKLSELIADVQGTHVATTWPQQAQLAVDGKWDELQTLQDELHGGVEKA